ncbi:MAG: MarC family protein [Cyanobacteriota bacterium]|nr:MarC family protein [Cyanobacteriota bacterium]
MPQLPLGKLLVLLFLMSGPLRVIPSFAALTGALGASTRNQLALRSVLYAALAVVIAVFAGHRVLEAWDTTPQALTAATGLVLLLTALQPLVGWPPAPSTAIPAAVDDGDIGRFALSPLAFPIIVPPFAIGVLVLFAAFFPDPIQQSQMVAAAWALLLIDYLGMRQARRILAMIGPVTLQLLGAVFGVLQLALAVQMMFWAVKSTFRAT